MPGTRPGIVGLKGVGDTLTNIVHLAGDAVMVSGATLFLFVLAHLVLRRTLLTAIVSVGVVALVLFFQSGVGGLLAGPMVTFVLVIVLVLRFGILAMATAFYVSRLIATSPVTLDTTAWTFPQTGLLLAFLVGLAFWAMRTSVVGTPFFQEHA
jgi:hypothetical protein